MLITIDIYKCLNCNSFPKYLENMFTLRQSEYSFRRTNILSLCKPVTSTYGLNSFRYFASKNWNSLPNNVRSESTLSGFRRLLKAFFFHVYVNRFLCMYFDLFYVDLLYLVLEDS